MWATLLGALWSGLLSLIGLQRKDPIQKVEEHDINVAEKQISIVSDRTRPDGIDSLQSGRF